jgi:hypothetical protein
MIQLTKITKQHPLPSSTKFQLNILPHVSNNRNFNTLSFELLYILFPYLFAIIIYQPELIQ